MLFVPVQTISVENEGFLEIGDPQNHGVQYYNNIISGWWLSPTPLKNDGLRQLFTLFPTEWKVKKFHGSNQQPDRIYGHL